VEPVTDVDGHHPSQIGLADRPLKLFQGPAQLQMSDRCGLLPPKVLDPE
jgi:hypothetical protein